MNLNVGCGRVMIGGYEGLDIKDFGQEYIMDVRSGIPIPIVWEVGKKWQQIRANHFIEHLTQEEVINFMNDCHSKCEELYIEVPHKDSKGAWDITHKSFYNERTFRGFEREDREDYGIKRWKIKKIIVKPEKNIFVWMTPCID